MENYIALLLLVVPGFMAQKIHDRISDDRKEVDKFKLTIISLICSVFILLATYEYLVLFCSLGAFTISDVGERLKSASFLVDYIWVVLFSTIFVSVVREGFKFAYDKAINKVRKSTGKNVTFDRDVFSRLFNDGNSHIVSIHKDEKEIGRGVIKFINDERKYELYLENVEEIGEISRSIECDKLKKVMGIYYDIEHNVKIVEYHNDLDIAT